MAFAASRRDRMNDADAELESLVRDALSQWDADGDWYAELLNAASVLWLEIFEVEAPSADPDRFIGRYREMAGESLAQTAEPSSPPTEAEVNRVTYWLSTATINNATYWGNQAHGGTGMRWVTMSDASVRETHRRANGQIAGSDGTFEIGGFDLHYPGEPVGPPEVWINCRCILAPARVEGALSMDAITADMAGIVADVDDLPEDGELPVDELEDDEDEVTEIPVHGVAAVEGRPTGDGRQFAVDAIEYGTLPQPIGYEFESAHGGDNSKVAIIGRIDEFFKVEVDGIVEVRFRGVLFPGKEYTGQAIDGIVDRSYGGLSVIVDSIAVDVDAMERDELEAEPGSMLTQTFSKARIRRFDMVPTPAYQEAYIALGPEFPDEMDPEALAACLSCAEESAALDDGFRIVDLTELTDEEIEAYEAMSEEEKEAFEEERNLIIASAFAPGTKDGPGWITHPVPTGRIRRYWTRGEGAAKIRWGQPGDFNRCRRQLAKYIVNPDWLAGACANMHKEALGFWPGQERGGRHGSEGIKPMTLMASAVATRPAEAFRDPEFTGPTPVTIDGDRIFGHIATWGVCHIGIQDQCVTAPHSASNYGFYRTGVVFTDEGQIPVGQITMGTGHASIKANAKNAVAHYDNTGSVVADVATGEDAYGIWFAGVLRPGLTDEQVAALAASALSGDWRRTATGLELVAALAVNVPGFPIPRTALAASAMADGEGQRIDDINIDIENVDAVYGISPVERQGAVTAALFPNAEEIAGIVRTAVDEYRAAQAADQAREERLSAITPFLDKAREHSLSRVQSYFQEA